MTYKDLPVPRPDTPLTHGGTLLARQPVLLCRSCGATYSANPGDYWNRPADTVIECGECAEPLVLAETRTVHLPYQTEVEFHTFVQRLWAREAHDGE